MPGRYTLFILLILTSLVRSARADNAVSMLFCVPNSEVPLAQLERLAPQLQTVCSECTVDVLRKFYIHFNPAFAGTTASVDLASHAPFDLGSDEQWRGVQPVSASLIQEAYGRNPPGCTTPVAHFRNAAGVELTFVPVKHEYDSSPDEIAQQRQLIEREFRRQAPTSVVLEGMPEQISCMQALHTLLEPKAEISAENEYTLQLALRNGADAHGGESSEPCLNPEDTRGMKILTMAGGAVHSPYYDPQKPLQDQFESMQAGWGPAPAWTFAQFQAWYFKQNGRAFVPNDKKQAFDDFTPTFYIAKSGKAAGGTNRLMDAMDSCRNQCAMASIHRELARTGNVMVVYGNGHLPEELPVFEAAFGRSNGPAAKCDSTPVMDLGLSTHCP
jgi:hypothetical protein